MHILTGSESSDAAVSTRADDAPGAGWLARGARALMDAARWMLASLINVPRLRGKQRRLELSETLTLGNRRQLFLVVCDQQRYLVGAGADSVGTIVAMGTAADTSEPKETSPVKEITGPQLVRPRRVEKRRGHRDDLVPGLLPGQELWR